MTGAYCMTVLMLIDIVSYSEGGSGLTANKITIRSLRKSLSGSQQQHNMPTSCVCNMVPSRVGSIGPIQCIKNSVESLQEH